MAGVHRFTMGCCMKPSRALLVIVSCMLSGCPPATAPSGTGHLGHSVAAPESLNITITQFKHKDQTLYGGTTKIPADSHIRWLKLQPLSVVTVVEEVPKTENSTKPYRTVHQTNVPAGRPVDVPISAQPSEHETVVVVSSTPPGPNLVDGKDLCVWCITTLEIQCCPKTHLEGSPEEDY